MSEKNESVFENEEFLTLLLKYERMLTSRDAIFFDVEEFEQIIDYYLDELQYENATEAARLGEIQHPASVEIKYKIIHVYLEQGMGKNALEILDKIPGWEHSNAEFYYLKGTALCLTGKMHEAEKSFDQGLKLSQEDTFEVLLNIAIAFENARQYHLAIKYLEQAHEQNPGYLSVIYDLGYFYERLDQYDTSVEYYQKYLDIDPFSENVWYNLGVAYFKMEQPEKAIKAYDYSIAINPDYASSYFNKANTLSSMEKYQEAINVILEFIEMEPDNAQALSFLGDCYEQMNKYPKALEAYKKIIEIDNTDSEGWFGAGMILYQMNNLPEATIYLLKALEFDPKNTDYWINLGYIYEESSKKEEAVKCYRQVIRIDKTDHDGWISLSGMLLTMGEYTKAMDYLLEAEKNFPGDEKIGIMIAQCSFLTGNSVKGLEYLESSLMKAPYLESEFKRFYDESLWNEAIRNVIRKYTK